MTPHETTDAASMTSAMPAGPTTPEDAVAAALAPVRDVRTATFALG